MACFERGVSERTPACRCCERIPRRFDRVRKQGVRVDFPRARGSGIGWFEHGSEDIIGLSRCPAGIGNVIRGCGGGVGMNIRSGSAGLLDGGNGDGIRRFGCGWGGIVALTVAIGIIEEPAGRSSGVAGLFGSESERALGPCGYCDQQGQRYRQQFRPFRALFLSSRRPARTGGPAMRIYTVNCFY